MILVCGILGCFGQAFKRSSSTTSLGAGEPSNQTHHQINGERHHHHYHYGDRNQGRGVRSTSHNALTATSPQPGARGSTAPGPPGSETDWRIAPGAGPSRTATAAATAATFNTTTNTPATAQASSPSDGDAQGSGAGSAAAASSSAPAATTHHAGLVKLDRDGACRRTPLHVAAERGQLHVLSSIIENLCCSATAALLSPPEPTSGEEEAEGASAGGGGGEDSYGMAGELQRSRVMGFSEPGPSGRQQQQRGGVGGSSGSSSGSGSGGVGGRNLTEGFLVGRPGAGGAPLAPEQYIQLNLNMQDAEGTTALSLACRFGHVDCCRLLLANGSGRTLADARGNTPLHYAALRGHLGVLFMLLDEFLEPGQPEEEELKGYVDARNHAGCTPLHYAVWGRQSGSVQVLLQHGADVLPRNYRPAQELTPPVMVVGSTPLHLAAARGHVEICRIILKTFAERVLEPLQLSEDDPQPPTLASLDPRVQVNANGHMPYQVAQRLGFYPLAMLLRPSIPILRLFSDEERAVRFYGPVPLRAIAAEVLNKKLLGELDALAAAAARTLRKPPSPAAEAPPESVANGGGGGDAARRPVSAPATLEQLAEAEATETEEEARDGGAGAAAERPPHVVGTTNGTSDLPGRFTGSGGAATSASVSPPGRRVGAPLRQRNLEIAVAGGTVEYDGRPSAAARRPIVLEPPPSSPPLLLQSAGSSASSAAPRTPPVGVPAELQVLSPSGVSPRLVSPISMISLSPSSATAITGSPSASPQQLQLPNRFSSARRSTPPPLPTSTASNRSSVMASAAAAPMVAGLSRPPSATRANGQPTGASRSPVLLSLPGQPDVPELQTLRVAPTVRTGSEPTAAVMAAAAVEGSSGGLVAGDGSAVANGSGAADSGAAAAFYAPRTPARQPSGSHLHARSARLPGSPPGAVPYTSVATAAPPPPPFASAIMVHGIASGGSNTGMSTATTRPTTSSLTTSSSLGTAVVLDGGLFGTAPRSDDGSRDGGLFRIRSNPLFEDVHNADGTATAAPPSQPLLATAGGGGGADAPAAARGMAALAEDITEDDEPGASTAGPGGVTVTHISVTPFASQPSEHGDDDNGSSSGGMRSPAAVGSVPAAPDVRMSYVRPTTAAAAAAATLTAVDDEDLECGICMELLPLVAISPCRHQICGPCARRICCLNIQKPSHCPFCRATISGFVAPAPLTTTVT